MRVYSLDSRVYNSRFIGFMEIGSSVQGSGFRVQGSGFRVQGSRFKA